MHRSKSNTRSDSESYHHRSPRLGVLVTATFTVQLDPALSHGRGEDPRRWSPHGKDVRSNGRHQIILQVHRRQTSLARPAYRWERRTRARNRRFPRSPVRWHMSQILPLRLTSLVLLPPLPRFVFWLDSLVALFRMLLLQCNRQHHHYQYHQHHHNSSSSSNGCKFSKLNVPPLHY
jgi:hypothetical protein